MAEEKGTGVPSVSGCLSPGEQEWCMFMGTAEAARGSMRCYKVPLRAVIVHAFKSLKLQDSLSRAASVFAGEMLETPSVRGF